MTAKTTVAELSNLVDEAQADVVDRRRMRLTLAIVGATGAFVSGVMFGGRLGGRANIALVLASLGVACLAVDVVFRLGPGSLNDMDEPAAPRPRPYPAMTVGPLTYLDPKRSDGAGGKPAGGDRPKELA